MKQRLADFKNARLGQRLMIALFLSLIANASVAQPRFSSLESMMRARQQQRNLMLQQQSHSLNPDAVLPRIKLQFQMPPQAELKGRRLPGVTRDLASRLAMYNFVIVDNTKYRDFYELYRANRLRGISNFVTDDSIVHPYLGFTNRVLADAIEQHITPELEDFLKSMLSVTMADFKRSEDAAVREDIEHNMAFICLGLKLLSPGYTPPALGHLRDLVKNDFVLVWGNVKARSSILGVDVDFSAFHPLGWYTSRVGLGNFYRAKAWLSRGYYPFVSDSSGAENSTFRRSLLLFSSLDRAMIEGQPAYDHWLKLNKCWSLLGTRQPQLEPGGVFPDQYKAVLEGPCHNDKVTQHTLADPLFSARLMVSMRNQLVGQQTEGKQSTNSTAATLSGQQKSNHRLAFHLFPVTGEAEPGWLRRIALTHLNERGFNGESSIALMILHSHGGLEANNILRDQGQDQAQLNALVDLDQMNAQSSPEGRARLSDGNNWDILSAYFEQPSKKSQEVFRSESWLLRRLESCFAGWVDSHLAINEPSSNAVSSRADSSANKPATAASQPQASRTVSGRAKEHRQAAYHYLEPSPVLFGRIAASAQRLKINLASLGYLASGDAQRLDDFARLALRLQRIAQAEIGKLAVAPADMDLLGKIDLFLQRVSSPLPAALSVSAGASQNPGGVTFGLGRPGMLYVLLNHRRRQIATRGAVYTYSELKGPPISNTTWTRQVGVTPAVAPSWTSNFQAAR